MVRGPMMLAATDARRSGTARSVAAAAIGLMGGVATAAYIDLIIRSAPPGLQGTTMMLAISLYWMAQRFGDR